MNERHGCSIVSLYVLAMLIMVSAACGVDPGALISRGPVSTRVIVTDVQVSDDGEKVEYITVRTDDGKELSLRL